jgi:hypothetical protein
VRARWLSDRAPTGYHTIHAIWSAEAQNLEGGPHGPEFRARCGCGRNRATMGAAACFHPTHLRLAHTHTQAVGFARIS